MWSSGRLFVFSYLLYLLCFVLMLLRKRMAINNGFSKDCIKKTKGKIGTKKNRNKG